MVRRYSNVSILRNKQKPTTFSLDNPAVFITCVADPECGHIGLDLERPFQGARRATLSVGFKQQVGPLKGEIALSIVVAATLPTGTGGITTGGVDPRRGRRSSSIRAISPVRRAHGYSSTWRSAIHSDSICASESSLTSRRTVDSKGHSGSISALTEAFRRLPLGINE